MGKVGGELVAATDPFRAVVSGPSVVVFLFNVMLVVGPKVGIKWVFDPEVRVVFGCAVTVTLGPGVEVVFTELEVVFPGLEVVFPGLEVVFPGLEVVFPGLEVVFPGLEVVFPGLEVVFPGLEVVFPGLEVVFPGLEVVFPGLEVVFLGLEVVFPGLEVVFPGLEFVFPGLEVVFLGLEEGKMAAVVFCCGDIVVVATETGIAQCSFRSTNTFLPCSLENDRGIEG